MESDAARRQEGGPDGAEPAQAKADGHANGSAAGVAPSDADAGDQDDQAPSRVASPASVSSPPYWQHTHNQVGGGWNGSSLSVDSVLPGAIMLQDNEQAEGEGGVSDDAREAGAGPGASYARDRNRACWARSVEVTDSVLVNGSTTNIGAFVVWNIRGSDMNIRKRYSSFDDFRKQLIQTFPSFEAAVPDLPPKSLVSRLRPSFLEKRRVGLQYFLNCILLNPQFSGSPILKDFLFS
ncbi:hypothetical protein P8C59_007998 [Phyllachora maydis]|uniref:Endosomal/vacuolar adapter protein YPT35 n=1 Tax=Phyllachora maydis TaxID=1825666 RepID=A0AAD9I9L1_9PEZI|nr:hypothetical protein P8C59_007998 [Phyllachora maydis]